MLGITRRSCGTLRRVAARAPQLVVRTHERVFKNGGGGLNG